MYKKGDKIIGVFGAMFPIEEGEIISVDYDMKLDGAYAVDVLFHEDGAVKKITQSSEVDTLLKYICSRLARMGSNSDLTSISISTSTSIVSPYLYLHYSISL